MIGDFGPVFGLSNPFKWECPVIIYLLLANQQSLTEAQTEQIVLPVRKHKGISIFLLHDWSVIYTVQIEPVNLSWDENEKHQFCYFVPQTPIHATIGFCVIFVQLQFNLTCFKQVLCIRWPGRILYKQLWNEFTASRRTQFSALHSFVYVCMWKINILLRIVIGCISIHPSMHCSFPWVGSWGQQPQEAPRLPWPSHLLQLLQWDPEAFPGQPRDIIPPLFPGSFLRSRVSETCPEHQGGVKEESKPDATSAVSSRCRGAVALLQAPPWWLSPSPYPWGWSQPPYGRNSIQPLVLLVISQSPWLSWGKECRWTGKSRASPFDLGPSSPRRTLSMQTPHRSASWSCVPSFPHL